MAAGEVKDEGLEGAIVHVAKKLDYNYSLTLYRKLWLVTTFLWYYQLVLEKVYVMDA